MFVLDEADSCQGIAEGQSVGCSYAKEMVSKAYSTSNDGNCVAQPEK
jgi:hypothetical protein